MDWVLTVMCVELSLAWGWICSPKTAGELSSPPAVCALSVCAQVSACVSG